MPTIRIPLIPANRPWFDPATGIPTKEFARAFHDNIRRTGGQSADYVAVALETASIAAATVTAVNVGVVVPVEGGAVELNPSNPLSSQSYGDGTAAILVAGHTRTGAGAAIVAGAVGSALTEGRTYYVFYDDPTNAGGVVTFEASTSIGDVGTKRLIGSIALPYTPTTSGVETIPDYIPPGYLTP